MRSGNYSSNDQIATDVFGKLPPVNSHSYPFYNIDTLRAWVDWNSDDFFVQSEFALRPGPNKVLDQSMKDGDVIFVNTGNIAR